MKTSLLQESRRDHKPGKTPKIKKAKDLKIRNKAKSEKTPKKTRTRSNRVLNKDGEAQVFLFIYLDHQRVQFPTGIFLNPNQWDKEKSLVRRTCKECGAHNRKASIMSSDLLAESRSRRISFLFGTLLTARTVMDYRFNLVIRSAQHRIFYSVNPD